MNGVLVGACRSKRSVEPLCSRLGFMSVSLNLASVYSVNQSVKKASCLYSDPIKTLKLKNRNNQETV